MVDECEQELPADVSEIEESDKLFSLEQQPEEAEEAAGNARLMDSRGEGDILISERVVVEMVRIPLTASSFLPSVRCFLPSISFLLRLPSLLPISLCTIGLSLSP